MKAVKLVDKEKLEVCEVSDIKSVAGKVLIKVESCGICGSDIHNYHNGEPNGLVMGHEFAGTVVDPGARKDLKIGDRVTGLPISSCGKCDACKSANIQYCAHTWEKAVGLSLDNPGGFGQYLACRGDMVKLLPNNVDFDQASMVEPSAVSLHAINLSNMKIGDSVLIIGGGIIGLMAAEFAKLNGASYIALLETNPKRGNKSVAYGKVNEYYNALDEKSIPTLLSKTNGGFDVVVECCGNAPAVSEALMLTKAGGKIVLVGVSTEPISLPLVVGVMKEMTILGAIAYTEKEFETCIDLISKKKINVSKYIDARVALEEVQSSFEKLTSGNDSAIKIIVKPQI